MRHHLLDLTTAVLIATLSTSVLSDHTESQPLDRDLEGWMVGKFELMDHNGDAFTQDSLKDRWTFILFGDSHCEARCTAALTALAGMFRRIAGTDALKTTQVVYVSLDPEWKSAENLRRYLAPFDSRFIGASGTPEKVGQLAADLSPWGAPRGTGRSAGSLLLIGPDRYVRGEFLPPYDILRFTERFLKMRIGR
jgi:protein SCO1